MLPTPDSSPSLRCSPETSRRSANPGLLLGIFVLALAGLSAAAPALAGTGGDLLEVTFESDRAVYASGAPVELVARSCNPTDETIDITLACPCPSCSVELMIEEVSSGTEVAELGAGCIQVILPISYAPGECREDSYLWPQTEGLFSGIGDGGGGETVPPGTYRARYVWTPSGVSAPVVRETTFEIVAADVPSLTGFGLVLVVGSLLWLGVRRL